MLGSPMLGILNGCRNDKHVSIAKIIAYHSYHAIKPYTIIFKTFLERMLPIYTQHQCFGHVLLAATSPQLQAIMY